MALFRTQVFSVAKTDTPGKDTRMSAFSNTLTRLLAGHTQSEITEASGIPRSSIAQYASGDRGISVTALGQLLKAFPSARDQYDLVAAHLQDETPATAEPLVHISPAALLVAEPPAEYQADPEHVRRLNHCIELLRIRAHTDEDVRQLILDLGKILR